MSSWKCTCSLSKSNSSVRLSIRGHCVWCGWCPGFSGPFCCCKVAVVTFVRAGFQPFLQDPAVNAVWPHGTLSFGLPCVFTDSVFPNTLLFGEGRLSPCRGLRGQSRCLILRNPLLFFSITPLSLKTALYPCTSFPEKQLLPFQQTGNNARN